jgi:hypothetical protein
MCTPQECTKVSSKTFAKREQASNLSPTATSSSESTRTVNRMERASMNGAMAHTMKGNSLTALKKGKGRGMKTQTLIMKVRCIGIKSMVRGFSTIRMEVTWREFSLMESLVKENCTMSIRKS